MSCFFRHTWSKWCEPVEVGYVQVSDTGQRVEGVKQKQRRTCTRCGKVEQRYL